MITNKHLEYDHLAINKLTRVANKLSRISSHVGETIRRTLKTGRIPSADIRYLRILSCDEKARVALSDQIANNKLPVLKASVAAGAGYNLKTLDGKIFIKKSRSEKTHHRESAFYEYVTSHTESGFDAEQNPHSWHRELAQFMPKYFGKISAIEGNYILLQDLSSGMDSQSMVDIKPGKISRDSDRRSKGVCLEINGARLLRKGGDVLTFDFRKQWRHFTLEEAHGTFNELFSTLPVAVRESLLEFLQRLRRVLLDKDKILIRDSSILVVWDQSSGAGDSKNCETKLIDFQKGSSELAGPSEYYLAGVEQAISWMEKLQHNARR